MSQKEIWDDLVGDAWVRHADVMARHSAPFGEAAMEQLGALEGTTVLDVGCGTGETTVELACRGATEVLGVDLSARMVAKAQGRAEERRLTGVRFEAGDVTTLAAPPSRFDAIYSRFGVMFFDDAVGAFTHLRSLLRADGHLGFSAWGDPFSNPWMLLPVMASVPLLGPPQMPGPGEPGPFSLGTPDRVHDVLNASGYRDLTIAELSLERVHPAGNAEAVAALVVETVPPLAEGVRQAPGVADELRAAVADALRPHERDGSVVLTAAALIVGARNTTRGA